ncbi:hypothetical protein DFH07DRAFT_4474 [Mycena maculata]|uniref:DUF6699 domain-containing protein n=1 Tax=Mycena maculata TaxID=230809 RepID=A0AAD7P2F4_9AGAR|nr:hypothetical protein DFH07DRAFT_4474 [Mycena maculata]
MAPKQLRFNPTVDEYEERDDQPTCASGSIPILQSALRPGQCLALDFSLPSAFFRADPRLNHTLMSKPACNPPQSRVTVRVASAHSEHGLCTFPVVHNPEGDAVTVGDVLTAIRDKLRQVDATTDGNAQWYHARRVRTVDQYAGNLHAAERRETQRAEEAAGTRRVDRLLGDVIFNGIVVCPERGYWRVDLQASSRYAMD